MSIERLQSATSEHGRQTKQKKVIAELKNGESIFKVRNKNSNGKLSDVITYKDFNGDGVIMEDELYMIDRYEHNTDGSQTVKRYKDKDGDGYSDSVTTFNYDRNKNKTGQAITNLEDINSVRNRQHMAHEVTNREMMSIKNALVIGDGASDPILGVGNKSKQNKTIANLTTSEYNNKANIATDNNGNKILRVDYGNNNQYLFDEEEVRTPDGKLVSYSRGYFGESRSEMIIEKLLFDENGEIAQVIEFEYSHGKLVSQKNIPIEDRLTLRGAIVHIGITPADGWGDPELEKFAQDHGFSIAGHN
ncbi:hypothetical protein IJ579_09555 [bacterium]|nr:hypothetical protein [bacterium]